VSEPPASEDRSVLSRPARPPDAVLHYGPEPEHIVEVRWPAPTQQVERPLLLLVHGGFWRPEYDRAHTAPMGEALAAAGWTVATIEYRRLPGRPDATLQDVQRALEQVPGLISQHNGKVLLLGHSAGGHLVLWAAARCHSAALRGVVALAPVADLQLAHSAALDKDAVVAFLGVEPRERCDLDPARLPTPHAPVIVLHGEHDNIVPLAISQSYQAQHPHAKLIRLAGAGHFAVIDPLTQAWQAVLASASSLV
jgi:acetyl esterase/lipase